MAAVAEHPIHGQIQRLATINSDPASGGITREIFTSEYAEAAEAVSELMRNAGLEVRFDSFGNLFGRVAGRRPELPAVLTGSHVDTTLNAGAYDGVLGVLGAIEAIRILRAGGWAPDRTVEVVCFAGEEPRFGSGCIGSRAMMGRLTPTDLDAMVDRDGVSIAQAMRASGFDPAAVDLARLDSHHVHAFVELHIEQGTRLESLGVPIGVVTAIAAPHDLRVSITGRAAHAGATPMSGRFDSLAGAAEAMVELERLARSSSSGTTVATIGVIEVSPGAINVIPGATELQVDIRDSDIAARTAVVDGFLAAVDRITGERGLTHTVETITVDRPAACSAVVVEAARRATQQLDIPSVDLISGAYHDAMVLGIEIPMGMIFVPSRHGISHHPAEYTEPDDIERGVEVLAETLRQLAASP